ncbi:hypothetical protein ACVW0P_003178 [Mucilaginibacter sp. UYNi724]
MIKIEHDDLPLLIQAHRDGLKPGVAERLKLHRTALQVMNGLAVKSLADLPIDAPNLGIRTITAQLKPYLIAPKAMTQQAHWAQIQNAALCKPYFRTHHVLLISLLNNLLAFDAIEDLLTALPARLLQLEAGYNLAALDMSVVKPLLAQIISYDDFTSKEKYTYDAYQLAESLQVNVCPYCNRSYTSTVITKPGRKKIIRPTFDHFFDQARHPLLALSFYNLVPSCTLCNSSLKGKKEFSLQTHLHPYLYGFDEQVTFDYDQKNLHKDKSHPDNFKVKLTCHLPTRDPKYLQCKGRKRSKTDGNMTIFKLEEIYQSHADVVGELQMKTDQASSWYARSLRGLFDKMQTNDQEFYRFYFGNYFDEKEFNKRPLAKLTKDIVTKKLPEFKTIKT